MQGVLRPGIRSGRAGNRKWGGGAAWGRDGLCGEPESAGGTEGTGGAVNRTYPGRCHQRTGQSEESIWLRASS